MTYEMPANVKAALVLLQWDIDRVQVTLAALIEDVDG